MSDSRLFQDLPPHREAMSRGDWDRALSLLESEARQKGEAGLSPDEALTLAELYGLRGDVDRSVAILKTLSEKPEPQVATRALLELALTAMQRGKAPFDEVKALLEKASSVAGADKRLNGLVASVEGRFYWKSSQFRKAGECLEKAKGLLEESGAEEDLAKVLDSLAMFYEHSGERERALSYYSLSLSKKAQCRDFHGIGITLGNLGRFHLRMNEPELALSCLTDDLRIAETIRDLRAQVVVKINIGQALTELDRLDEAQKVLEEALALARQQGWGPQEAYALKDLARVVARTGDLQKALDLIREALALGPEKTPDYIRGQLLLTQGELLVELGDADKANSALEDACQVFDGLGAQQERALALHGLAKIAEKRGEWNNCIYLLEEGMNVLATVGFSALKPFEESFRRLKMASQQRTLPRSIGPYRVVSRLGSGAFGEVFRAFDGREGASRGDVAVKVLRLEGIGEEERAERIRRFRREYEILERISHPNVVRFVDFGEEPTPHLVEEYVQGGDLTQFLGGNNTLPLDVLLKLGKGILCGLGALHKQGIIHRDLKPQNVLLRETNQPVIVDFGLARMLELTRLTLQSAVMGTLAFMSPEQLRGEAVDERADIYAFGVLFYEALSGRPPYEGKTFGELLASVGKAKPPSLADLRPSLPPEIVHCVARCLEKDKEQRYPSAAAVVAELEKVMPSL